MFRRPNLYTSYETETQVLPTFTKKVIAVFAEIAHFLPMRIWLPGAGVGAALVGIIVSPVAVRLRGLYLAIVTLGLVFLGIHMGNTDWGRKFAGDPSLGRSFPEMDVRVWKEETPLVS
ncbi:MAG: hypothetical protein VW964_04595, partial [Ilumatobacter sp.]